MTTKRIVYVRDDGGISIIIPAPEAASQEETEDQFVSRIAAKDVPPGKSFFIVDAASIPSRRFRNSWESQANTVTVMMSPARQQRINEVRAERLSLLAEADTELARLQDTGGSTAAINNVRQYRQALRNLPQTIQADPAWIAITNAIQLEAYVIPWPVKPF